MIFKIGERVQVSKLSSKYHLKVGEIMQTDPVYNRYLVEFDSGSIFSLNDCEWFDDDEIYLVRENLWSTQTSYTGTGFSNSRCFHSWKVDYSSPFVKKDYYSCEKCKMKKEDYDKETEDSF